MFSVHGLFAKYYSLKGVETITKFFPKVPEFLSPTPRPKVAIVIQGPVPNRKSEKQVEESISHYSKIFPQSPIVLSTWLNHARTLRSPGKNIHIVRSVDPGPSNPKNLDRQAISTFEGIKKASELGAEYTIKTRTDQRLVAPLAVEKLLAIWAQSKSELSIVVSSYGTGRYRLYGPTDQLQFAKTAVLLDFWEGLPSSGRHEVVSPDYDQLLYEISCRALSVQEVRLCVRYLLRIEQEVTWTWPNHAQLMASFFPVANSVGIGHLQLSRPVNVVDHVSYNKTAFHNLIEEHSSLEFWLTLHNSATRPSPPYLLLIEALKAKSLDQCMSLMSTQTY